MNVVDLRETFILMGVSKCFCLLLFIAIFCETIEKMIFLYIDTLIGSQRLSEMCSKKKHRKINSIRFYTLEFLYCQLFFSHLKSYISFIINKIQPTNEKVHICRFFGNQYIFEISQNMKSNHPLGLEHFGEKKPQILDIMKLRNVEPKSGVFFQKINTKDGGVFPKPPRFWKL